MMLSKEYTKRKRKEKSVLKYNILEYLVCFELLKTYRVQRWWEPIDRAHEIFVNHKNIIKSLKNNEFNPDCRLAKSIPTIPQPRRKLRSIKDNMVDNIKQLVYVVYYDMCKDENI